MAGALKQAIPQPTALQRLAFKSGSLLLTAVVGRRSSRAARRAGRRPTARSSGRGSIGGCWWLLPACRPASGWRRRQLLVGHYLAQVPPRPGTAASSRSSARVRSARVPQGINTRVLLKVLEYLSSYFYIIKSLHFYIIKK